MSYVLIKHSLKYPDFGVAALTEVELTKTFVSKKFSFPFPASRVEVANQGVVAIYFNDTLPLETLNKIARSVALGLSGK
jgi:ribonuclease BN (tRNA processing enzyme)